MISRGQRRHILLSSILVSFSLFVSSQLTYANWQVVWDEPELIVRGFRAGSNGYYDELWVYQTASLGAPVVQYGIADARGRASGYHRWSRTEWRYAGFDAAGTIYLEQVPLIASSLVPPRDEPGSAEARYGFHEDLSARRMTARIPSGVPFTLRTGRFSITLKIEPRDHGVAAIAFLADPS